MKPRYLFLILSLIASFGSAQSGPYNDLWRKVESLEKQGLPKSALEVVNQIETKAVNDANESQQIRVLIYQSKYALTIEEDAQLKIISKFQDKVKQSNPPIKNVLQNLVADLYWSYFQQHRYQFYNRTRTSEKPSDDFRTWDLETLFNEIHLQFQASLENTAYLQKTEISDFDDILIKKDDSEIYRPTLYDILAHNALDFYKHDENSITKPADAFELDDAEYLSELNSFIILETDSADSSSLQFNALKIYQSLMKFHDDKKNKEALIDVDIERLQFVFQNYIGTNKEELYLEALETGRSQFNDYKACALYDFNIAKLFYDQGQKYDYKNESTEKFQWKIKEALELCNSTISQFKDSRGAKLCELLKKQILDLSLDIRLEGYIPSDSYSRLLINYQNIEELTFKIYEVGIQDIQNFKKIYRSDLKKAYLDKKNPTKTFTSSLKSVGDFQKHSTEVIVPKLANGHYIIEAKVKDNNELIAATTLQATNLAVVDQTTPDAISYQVIDRNNGSPIQNARVILSYQNNYNNDYKTQTLQTDSQGKIKVQKQSRSYQNIDLTIKSTNQTGYFGSYYAYSRENRVNEINYSAFLFTDRSIYRPGQTVYFKGIIIKSQDKNSQIVADKNVSVTLRNVNWEIVKTLDLKTNEFGSVASEFILPDSGLTGNYILQIASESINLNSQTSISVEEYKRPKFETSFEPVSKTFQVNDSVSVDGTAMAYAGSSISDAKVVYRVTRKIQYPRWCYWSRPFYNSEPQEIAHGETVTDKNGHFNIDFKAIPDMSVDKENLPIFNYEVTADVTDVNGETRSATKIVNVGYHALTIDVLVDDKIDKSGNDHSIKIETKNLNGEFIATDVTLKVIKLKAPERVLRPRSWEAPDYQDINKSEFIEKFPHDPYDEEDVSSWPESTVVLEKTFNTKDQEEVSLGIIDKWKSGAYKVIATAKDRFNQDVRGKALTDVFSESDDTVPDNKLFKFWTDKTTYKSGDNVILSLGSAAKDLTVTVAVEKNKKIIKNFMVPLHNSVKTIAIPVGKDDLGGFVIHYSYAAFNYFKSGTINVNVPYPNSELDIETLTFRDKLKPGSEETWSFKINGEKGDKVTAELLASMYDASLDQFREHDWQFNPLPNLNYHSQIQFRANQSFGQNFFWIDSSGKVYSNFQIQEYDGFNWFGLNFGNYRSVRIRGVASMNVQADSVEITENDAALEEVVTVGYGVKRKDSVEKVFDDKMNSQDLESSIPDNKLSQVQVRKNLKETAFFFPQLSTDVDGNISFSFKTPEALTKWKIQLLTHTKELASSVKSMTAVTQKELMVIPNVPRFLRQGDQITISSKISNLTDNSMSGNAKLVLTNALDNTDISNRMLSDKNSTKDFTVDGKENTQVSWSLFIPENVQAVQYKIVALSGNFSDGEQNVLPVLTNRMLVTETLPMWTSSNETKTFTLDKLKTNTSSSLKHHRLTLEMTSNPAWYAVQSLPYLMEYPYDCNEQIFSRYYANALASHIANSNPRVKEVFNQWKNSGSLISNLEKNQELKNILIEETPWVRDAQSETEQKQRFALLFDLNKMNNELSSAKRKLATNQMQNGAWSWFNDGPANRFITQYILTGFGHLDKLNVDSKNDNDMIARAMSYLDHEFIEEYKNLKKYNKDVDLSKDRLSPTQIHYLYMRSFFPHIKSSKEIETVKDYYLNQIKNYWLDQSLYSKGMMALITSRNSDVPTAKKILNSLKETSITSDEMGMYWKDNVASWYWYQAPIETQSLMIEAFSEIENDQEIIDQLRIWLLKNKQTNSWKTTKATADATYSLLLNGCDWLSIKDMVDVTIGDTKISPDTNPEIKVEAGTAYYKTSWQSSEINADMATVDIKKKGDGIAWGSLYWQYFEDLDKITSAKTPLSLKKELYLKRNTDKGEELSKITSDTKLEVGDLVRVRIELKSDRTMEFIHMKDMRAAGLEPINVISSYKWQDGLGYYESTKDAATNFFFDYLPKGIYVFEYDLRVNNAGNMSNGITTIQSMYAPEFSSHSKGIKLNIQ